MAAEGLFGEICSGCQFTDLEWVVYRVVTDGLLLSLRLRSLPEAVTEEAITVSEREANFVKFVEGEACR